MFHTFVYTLFEPLASDNYGVIKHNVKWEHFRTGCTNVIITINQKKTPGIGGF